MIFPLLFVEEIVFVIIFIFPTRKSVTTEFVPIVTPSIAPAFMSTVANVEVPVTSNPPLIVTFSLLFVVTIAKIPA